MARVVYEKRDRIGYITLNRPEALNALDDEGNDALWDIWADFHVDGGVDVAIVTRAGKAFRSGADLKTFLPKRRGCRSPSGNNPWGCGKAETVPRSPSRRGIAPRF